MTNSAHDPDLDPLIKPSRAKRTAIHRREHRITIVEKRGRVRLLLISICLFFVIYICFAMSTWADETSQMIVNVPPMDESLPGPFGEYLLFVCFWYFEFFFKLFFSQHKSEKI